MYYEYLSLCGAGLAVPGELMFYYSRSPNKPHVINLFIQDRKRNGPTIANIGMSLDKLIEVYPKLKIKWNNGKIAMPRIGESSKSIDWNNDVRPVIEEKFRSNEIPLCIYTPRSSHTRDN